MQTTSCWDTLCERTTCVKSNATSILCRFGGTIIVKQAPQQATNESAGAHLT
jgi:hypothetical protein